MTTVTVIIPVKDDARRLAHCLAAIAKNRSGNVVVDVVVADNGSSDESPAVAAAAGARVLVLPGLRVSQLRNLAAGGAVGELLAFVDADHEVAPGWLRAAADAMVQAQVGAAGALYSAPEDGTWVQRTYGAMRGRTRGRVEVAWLGSGNLIVRREAFQQIRGFDDSLDACEDVDLCQRLGKAGWKIIADERIRSVHLGDPPTLRALFFAELWRGRDNIRVTLRGPLGWRELPSLLVPVVDLIAGILLLAGVVAWPLWGPGSFRVAAIAAVIIWALAGLRAMKILSNEPGWNLRSIAQALAVALTYDLARALALVTRASHHRPASPVPAADQS